MLSCKILIQSKDKLQTEVSHQLPKLQAPEKLNFTNLWVSLQPLQQLDQFAERQWCLIPARNNCKPINHQDRMSPRACWACKKQNSFWFKSKIHKSNILYKIYSHTLLQLETILCKRDRCSSPQATRWVPKNKSERSIYAPRIYFNVVMHNVTCCQITKAKWNEVKGYLLNDPWKQITHYHVTGNWFIHGPCTTHMCILLEDQLF